MILQLFRLPPWNQFSVTDPVGNVEKVKGAGEAISNVSNEVYQAVSGVFGAAANGINLLVKYWYVPVIVGGVIVGYRLIKKSNPAAISADVIKALAAKN